MTEITHACPPDGSGLMPCCGRTPLEVSRFDRMTSDPEQVTCTPAPSCGEECAEGHVYAGRCALYDPTACVWPDCLTDGQQAGLAEQVRRSMLGEPTAAGPDQRQMCGCREAARTTPDNPATSSDRVAFDPVDCACPCEGCSHWCAGHPDRARCLGRQFAEILGDGAAYGTISRLLTAADARVVAAPATPDAGLRERVAAAIRKKVWIRLGPNAVQIAQEGGIVPLNFGEADAAADACLAVRDRRMEQLAAELATARADAARLDATLRTIHAELNKLDAECVYGTHFAQGARHAVDRIRPHLPNRTQEPTP